MDRGTMAKWQKIGEICVDSGTVMITDPCYIDSEWKRTNTKPGTYGFDGILGALMADSDETIHPPNTARVCFKSGYEGAAVAVTQFGGDGVYPVEAKLTEYGQIAEVRIVFIRS